MAEWIQPLELEKIFINVFAGNPDIFMAFALIIVSGMASYFRMTITTLFFALAMFILLFSTYTPQPILAFFAIIGGLTAGFVLSRFLDR